MVSMCICLNGIILCSLSVCFELLNLSNSLVSCIVSSTDLCDQWASTFFVHARTMLTGHLTWLRNCHVLFDYLGLHSSVIHVVNKLLFSHLSCSWQLHSFALTLTWPIYSPVLLLLSLSLNNLQYCNVRSVSFCCCLDFSCIVCDSPALLLYISCSFTVNVWMK